MNKNWYKKRIPEGKISVPEGKFLVPEEYEDAPREMLETFGWVRMQDLIPITDYDEYLAASMRELIDVPFDDLKPYLADNINKIFIDGNEFKAVFEEAKNNYARALNENNKLVRLFTESFAPLKWPTSYDEKLKFIFEAMRNKEATAHRRQYADEMWDAAVNNGRYKNEYEADRWLNEYETFNKENQEATKYHESLKRQMAEMACPELVSKKGDGEVSL